MTGAFRGDPAVKAALLTRLEHHAANGTLRFGATGWDGQGGSPLGVSVQGADSVDYAGRFGYPLALAGLLDPMTEHLPFDVGVEHILRWVTCVEPGADLSLVPEQIVDHVLIAMGADRLAAPYYMNLRAFYQAEAAGLTRSRSEWSELRRRIEFAAEEAEPKSDRRSALTVCATACWPLYTSKSVLPSVFSVWLRDVNRPPDPDFTAVDDARTLLILERIYQDTQPLRDAGERVDIPARFRSHAPELAAAYEAYLARANARYALRARMVPEIVLRHLADAGGCPTTSINRN